MVRFAKGAAVGDLLNLWQAEGGASRLCFQQLDRCRLMKEVLPTAPLHEHASTRAAADPG